MTNLDASITDMNLTARNTSTASKFGSWTAFYIQASMAGRIIQYVQPYLTSAGIPARTCQQYIFNSKTLAASMRALYARNIAQVIGRESSPAHLPVRDSLE